MCKSHNFLYKIIPSIKWQAFIIRKLIENCPQCNKEIDVDPEIRRLFAKPKWVDKEASLWPQINKEIIPHETQELLLKQEKSKVAIALRRWKWALTVGVFIFAIGLGLMNRMHNQRNIALIEKTLSEAQAKERPRVEVVSAEIGSQEAKTYVYQTRDASFLWFAPAKKIGG